MQRICLLSFLSLVLLTLWLTAPAQTADRLELKVATLSPEGSTVMNTLRAASKEIEQKTAGRVSLRIFPGGTMGSDAVVLRKMRSGQIHGSTLTAGGVSNVYSNYQILSLPLLFHNYQEADAARAKIEPQLTRNLESAGYISFGIVEAGFVYMMSNKPVKSPADLRGRKVWIPEGDPIGQTVFEVAQVSAIPLALPDVMTGLQTGLVDTVSTSPVGAVMLQWFTKVKYLTETPLLYAYGTIVLSKEAWGKIPAADQPAVREALTRRFKQLDIQNRQDNDSAMATLKKQGLTFVPLDPQGLPEMQSIADRAIEKLMRKNLFDASMLSQIRAAVQAVRQGK